MQTIEVIRMLQWWSSAVSKDPAPEPPTSGQEQNDWPPEDGEWFFIEVVDKYLLVGKSAISLLFLVS